MFIHGQADRVIDISHAQKLVNQYNQDKKNSEKCDFNTFANMEHNNYDIENHILIPIQKFLSDKNATL